MTKMWIDFSIEFSNSGNDRHYNGPIFYFWKPNKRNSLILKTTDKDAIIKVWFEGAGKHAKFASEMMRVNKLRGSLEFNKIQNKIEEIFEKNKTAYKPYEEFGRIDYYGW